MIAEARYLTHAGRTANRSRGFVASLFAKRLGLPLRAEGPLGPAGVFDGNYLVSEILADRRL